MSIVEFIGPLRKASHKARMIAILYWHAAWNGEECMSTARIREVLVSIRYKNAKRLNISDVLARAEHLVDRREVASGKYCWTLTDSGKREVEDLLGIDHTTREASDDVRSILGAIGNVAARKYVEEAILALESGALRASAVFLWAGAMQTIREKCFAKGATVLLAELKRHSQKTATIRRLEDLTAVKDRDLLESTPGLGVFDGQQKKALVECLNLRNQCGHPSSYWPRKLRIKAFIEDVAGIVWP